MRRRTAAEPTRQLALFDEPPSAPSAAPPTVAALPPIDSTGREPDELMREVEAWIEAEMRRLDPEAYVDSPKSVQEAVR